MVIVSSRAEKTAHPLAMVGCSHAMRRVQERIEFLAPTELTALILGETGSGKELVAQAFHLRSGRSSGPWVCVNCAGIPEGLVESELFGHVKGAFPGAIQDRLGRFESADGGTLFLDEIADTSPAAQARLLRAVETKRIERVGSNRTRAIDVRIIAATNKPLEEEVRAGRFRADLYYRLKVAVVEITPLRERREDIPLLVQHFIDQGNRLFPRPIVAIEEDAMEVLMRHRWPGNVRELRNAIECAHVNARGEHIRLADLPPLYSLGSSNGAACSGLALSLPVSAFDASTLCAVLADNRWHIARTAASLGVHSTTLWRLMQRLGIPGARSEG